MYTTVRTGLLCCEDQRVHKCAHDFHRKPFFDQLQELKCTQVCRSGFSVAKLKMCTSVHTSLCRCESWDVCRCVNKLCQPEELVYVFVGTILRSHWKYEHPHMCADESLCPDNCSNLNKRGLRRSSSFQFQRVRPLPRGFALARVHTAFFDSRRNMPGST